MSIQTDITVTLVEVEVGDDYDVLLTVRDPLRPDQGATTTSLTPDQAAELIEELRAVATEAREARASDDVARADAKTSHAFDVDVAPAPRSEREYPGVHMNMCAVGSSGSCFVSWCTCRCHNWAREVV